MNESFRSITAPKTLSYFMHRRFSVGKLCVSVVITKHGHQMTLDNQQYTCSWVTLDSIIELRNLVPPFYNELP